MIKYLKTILLFGLLLPGVSCKERYRPDIISSPKAYLVVEGVLNVNGPSTIRLTRTTKLDSLNIKAELNAQVIVEGRDNTTRTLSSAGSGNYTSSNLNLTINNEYRLRIRTSAGKEYLSEYVTAKLTPPIDSVGWKRDNERLQIYVNAHDASGNTRYYRWSFDETWEIRSYYHSRYIYIRSTNSVRDRTPAEDVSTGWKFSNSKVIALASSSRLQSDVIFEAPLQSIDRGDERLGVRYSILVRQYAMDKKGYDFYELMKRNTENLGTIFDVQPSEIKGNIQSLSDPLEPVIGYVSASTINEKRIFISNNQLPFEWRYYQQCPYFTVPIHPDSLRLFFYDGSNMPYDAVYHPITGLLIGYLSAASECVDVTVRGATVVRPSYW